MVPYTILRRLPALFFIASISLLQAQDSDRLTKDFHRGRRDALRALLPDSSVAIFFTNPSRNRSNDVDYQYSQNPDFYYLTGNIEPDGVLLLFKNEQHSVAFNSNEALFIEGPNRNSGTWSGPVLDCATAKDSLGIQSVFLNRDIGKISDMLCRQKKVLVIWPEFPRKASYSEYGLPFLVSGLRTALTCTKDDSVSLYGLMAQLREVKQPEELVLLKEAIDLTVKGFVKMMQTINPGMKEFQAQALVEHEARMSGSEYQGYPSITGAGENGCVLHYSTNRSKLDSGELVLVDIGAEYHGYTADITRTIPVSGVFSPEQKELYRLVLKAQQAGIAACKIGNSFNATHYAAKKVLADGLIQLGIIKDEAEITRYFMHGTSHYLGLDVHDSGTRGPLKAGTVITVEPGVYITNGADCDPKWWGIGIRIEDDILITEDGPVVLSGALPRDVAGIELLMKKKR